MQKSDLDIKNRWWKWNLLWFSDNTNASILCCSAQVYYCQLNGIDFLAPYETKSKLIKIVAYPTNAFSLCVISFINNCRS